MVIWPPSFDIYVIYATHVVPIQRPVLRRWLACDLRYRLCVIVSDYSRHFSAAALGYYERQVVVERLCQRCQCRGKYVQILEAGARNKEQDALIPADGPIVEHLPECSD